MQTKVEKDVAERIAAALEQMVEKLGNLEVKMEELTYELQAHGHMLADAVGAYDVEEEEGGCGTGCGSSDCGSGSTSSSEFIQIKK